MYGVHPMSMYTCIPNEYTPYTFPPLAAMSMGFSRMSMIFQDVYANRTHHFCFRTHWLSRPGVFAEYGWHTHRKNALRRVRTFFTEAYSSIPRNCNNSLATTKSFELHGINKNCVCRRALARRRHTGTAGCSAPPGPQEEWRPIGSSACP